jgi:glycerol-3-phosphate dehydrogenase
MAEDAVNAAQQYLSTASAPHPPVFDEGGTAGRGGACVTRHFPLLGSEGWEPAFWQTLVSNYYITPETARHLAGKFGTRAVEVLELARADRNLGTPIIAGLPPIQAEIVYAIRCEMATCIEDVLARRIGLQWFGWRPAMDAAPVVGGYLAQEYGWPADETAQAVRDYTLRLTRLSAIAGVASERALAV